LLLNLSQRLNKILSRGAKETSKVRDLNWLKKQIDSCTPIGKKMEYFLATGNIISRTGLDLMQFGGFSIIAEKINNMRYISHFRAVHRGQFFTTMKTTQPRKLLPESWGFMCPVHTPDGSPCGLLLHIASGCELISSPPNLNLSNFNLTLSSLGMIPVSNDLNLHISNDTYPVILDGNLVGYISTLLVNNFVNGLRKYKVLKIKHVPETLEIGFIPKSEHNVSLQYPGIFLFSCIARMVRRVKNLSLNKEEYIGPLEQIYLDIACLPEDIRSETTHQELDPIKMLSLVASLTPFCDYNQSPRNMYQCQMAKQTMGTPYYSYPYRADNKTYRIMFPQQPLVRTTAYEEYGFESHPSGTNAVVAVLSYTGYDMEDAMIINKSAYERGLGHGIVYKTKTKKINEYVRGQKGRSEYKYRLLDTEKFPSDYILVQQKLRGGLPSHIGSDGLPFIGTQMTQGMEEFIYIDTKKNAVVVSNYKDSEPSVIENLRVFNEQNEGDEISINFTYRYKRNPVIGDKFSSRHGQKGVLSNLWPQENMPFSESGITPDIIINPHAFPSRMTIGMLIESLAGKSGSLSGKFQSYSAFQQFEDDDATGYFGRELLEKGYNYYGNEVMYSGVSGLQLRADIYLGVVYYQRLRHMVNDKAQARSTGQIDVLTRQPLKGRKNQGGIRFGEMERDSLLSHGISYCLHDRLFNSSDYSEGYICSQCGELLGTLHIKETIKTAGTIFDTSREEKEKKRKENDNFFENTKVICRNCQKDNTCVKVAMPYVMRYLTNELAAMNIRLSFAIK
jgi:DNA-directed RNA polymerase I subunit RPA2